MITMKIRELCLERGIPHPPTALIKIGISQSMVTKYLDGKVDKMPVQHVEKLCLLLRCTPNQLYCWTPDTKNDDYPEHPLQPIRCKQTMNLQAKLKNMPLDELRRRMEG